MIKKLFSKYLLILFLIPALAGCGSSMSDVEYKYPEKVRGKYKTGAPPPEERETIFGKGGMNLFGDNKDETTGSTGIGVNSFLWRATLDTLAFMPLSSADPFGGVIITDWYAPPETPKERFKITAYILDRSLRSDGIKISAFRQEKNETGEWIDAKINPDMSTELEDSILTRARQLRITASTPKK